MVQLEVLKLLKETKEEKLSKKKRKKQNSDKKSNSKSNSYKGRRNNSKNNNNNMSITTIMQGITTHNVKDMILQITVTHVEQVIIWEKIATRKIKDI